MFWTQLKLGHKFPQVIIIIIHYSLNVDSVEHKQWQKDMTLPKGRRASSLTILEGNVKIFWDQKREASIRDSGDSIAFRCLPKPPQEKQAFGRGSLSAGFVVSWPCIGLSVDLDSDKESNRVGRDQERGQGQKPDPRVEEWGQEMFPF